MVTRYPVSSDLVRRLAVDMYAPVKFGYDVDSQSGGLERLDRCIVDMPDYVTSSAQDNAVRRPEDVLRIG